MTEIKKTYTNAVFGTHPKNLQDIHLPTKNVAIYQRDITPLQAELAALKAKSIECRANGSGEEIVCTLREFFQQYLPQAPILYKDVSDLLRLFAAITKADSFRLMLSTIRTNMCRKFHTDINDLRLLCTYIGPGTVWLPNEAIDFEALQTKGSERDIVKNHQLVQQAQTGDAIILKGALYPDASPILHRSPVIEEDGGKRLLLRIDTNANQNLWL